MLIRRWKAVSVALCLMASAVPAGAVETHVITVEVAQASFEDYTAFSDFLANSSPADPVPYALSQSGTAAMADIVALAEGRADQDGWLVLDSGDRVHLDSGDVVLVVPQGEANPQADGGPRAVVLVRGQGYATVIGRADVVVPSAL